MTGTRLPHSEIPGSKRACRSPRLIAACRVLHRLPSPRHPSCALTSLTTKKSIRIDCRISGAGVRHHCLTPAHGTPVGAPCAPIQFPQYMPVQLSKSRPSVGLLSDPACVARPADTCRYPECLPGVTPRVSEPLRLRPRAPPWPFAWWACLESNQGPRPYQGRALTN
jgi:hypothetical protein